MATGRQAAAALHSPDMLVALDCAYTYEEIEARRLAHVVTQLDLDGLFEHVWQVHPLLGASDGASGQPYGRARSTAMSGRHTVIEAPLGRFRRLRHLPAINLVLSQCLLFGRLSRLARQHPIRLITAADPFFLGLWGLAFSRVHRVPLVVKINANYDAMHEADGSLAYTRLIPWRWLQDLIARVVLSCADLVTVGSDDNLRYVIHHGAPHRRVAMVPTGDMVAPVHLAPPAERRPVAEEVDLLGRPFVVFVGRLESVKHPEAAVAVLGKLKAVVPGIALVIVGDGSQRLELEEQARRLGLTSDVRFVGTRDQRWIARALSSASVVVCPYSGLVLVEAALSGTPVVGYDVEWHAELISSDETGILVPYRDTDALAGAAAELLQNPARGRAIADAARTRTLQDMSPADAVQVKRSIYSALLSGAAEERRQRQVRRTRRQRSPLRRRTSHTRESAREPSRSTEEGPH